MSRLQKYILIVIVMLVVVTVILVAATSITVDDGLGFLFFSAIVLGLLVTLITKYEKTVTINDYERGLLFIKGQLRDVVGAGAYTWFSKHQTITKVDLRIQTLTLTGQEVMSSDNAALKISVAAQYRISDVKKALLEYQSYREALYAALQLAVREVIGGATIDQLLQQRSQFDQQLFERATPAVTAIGLELISFDVRDIMLPGQLKHMFTQVLEARQQGLAALERARGEQAALRSLANAARMLENNPTLYQLRLLQGIDQSKGNTFVVHLGDQHPESRPTQES